MGKFNDISGVKFNKLTAIKYVGKRKWLCYCECGNYCYANSSELKNGHTKSCGCLRKKYNIDEEFFNLIDTEEKAYILGMLSSDGNVTIKPYNAKIDLKDEDIDVLIKIMNSMNYNFNIKKYKQKSKIKNKEYIVDMCRLNITNKKIVLKLVEYGIVPNKTENLDFKFSCMDKKLYRHFLRGYFDGDGSVSVDKKNHVSVNITSNEKMIIKFIEILKEEIENYEPHVYVRNKENENCKTISITKNKEKELFLNFLYKDCNIYMDRKFKKYKEAISILEKTQTTK